MTRQAELRDSRNCQAGMKHLFNLFDWVSAALSRGETYMNQHTFFSAQMGESGEVFVLSMTYLNAVGGLAYNQKY